MEISNRNVMNSHAANAKTIDQELKWFQQLIVLRTKVTFELTEKEEAITNLTPPDITEDASAYANFVNSYEFGIAERLVLILALVPHVKPEVLDLLYLKNTMYDIPFTEFGGIRVDKHKGYLPTGQTALFLLAGSDLEKRFELLRIFQNEHAFSVDGILKLGTVDSHIPETFGVLSIAPEIISRLITGTILKPDFNEHFPAKRIITQQDWEDLVVSDKLLKGLDEIKEYIKHGKHLKNDFDFGRRIKPGFKVLFTGPPGTGKTLTATLLGKVCELDVYKVDLSMVVSKYIGETEKNLGRVFDKAESKNWILFFDEADALFGKRSSTSHANDRYANQEVSFLLQRMETFNGLVILCSNFKNNIDEAFFRRFQLVLDFEKPDVYQRMQLWNDSKTKDFEYEDKIDVENLAEKYELTAASIINILHHCLLKCMGRNDRVILLEDIMQGIKTEMLKEGKSLMN